MALGWGTGIGHRDGGVLCDSRDPCAVGRAPLSCRGKCSTGAGSRATDSMSAPERIGAFFDFDGTLMESPSLERRFFAYLYRRGEIQRENFERWAAQAARAFLRKPRAAFLGNKFYLAGIHDSFVEEWAGIIAKDSLPLLPDGAAQIRWHLERGHRVVLVTGTLAPLLRAIASHLPAGVVIHATEVE